MAQAVGTRITLSEYTHAEPCGHVCALMRLDLAPELSSQQRTAEAAAKLDTAGATRVLALRTITMTRDGGKRSTTPECCWGCGVRVIVPLVGVVRRGPMRGLWPQWEGWVVQPAPSSETQTRRRGLVQVGARRGRRRPRN